MRRPWLVTLCAMLVLDVLLLIGFIGTWMACIWTTGQDPLSIKYGNTAFALFVMLLVSGSFTFLAVVAAEAEKEHQVAVNKRGEMNAR